MNQNKKKNITEPKSCKFEVGGADHEPPIGVGGGSFFFDVPKEFELANSDRSGAYYVYKFHSKSGTIYSAINGVNVTTEQRNGWITFNTYFMDETDAARLNIWLGKDKDGPTDNDPNVIIDGTDGGSIMITQPLMNSQPLSKKRRPVRYLTQDQNFSAIKWNIVNGQGKIINQGDANDDMYYFYVSFHDE